MSLEAEIERLSIAIEGLTTEIAKDFVTVQETKKPTTSKKGKGKTKAAEPEAEDIDDKLKAVMAQAKEATEAGVKITVIRDFIKSLSCGETLANVADKGGINELNKVANFITTETEKLEQL